MYAKEGEFVKDFAKRTRKNLEYMKNCEYDVTQLINSSVGLIILPKEEHLICIADNMIGDDLYNEMVKCIKVNTYEKCNLSEIVRHIRNAIAHNRIEFKAEKESIGKIGKIEEIIIKDHRYRNKYREAADFKMIITIELLYEFFCAFSNAVIEQPLVNKNKVVVK